VRRLSATPSSQYIYIIQAIHYTTLALVEVQPSTLLGLLVPVVLQDVPCVLVQVLISALNAMLAILGLEVDAAIQTV